MVEINDKSAGRLEPMPDTGIRTEFIEANGLRFEVDMCGKGRKLALCLHGFPELAYSWRYQLPLLAELGYCAWAPNLRGYGNSSRPETVANYAMPHLTADVAGLIDAAQADSVVLIGHDWGGAIAWDFALRGIRPLDRLVVMNLPHPTLFARGVRRWPQLRRSWYMLFFQLPWLPERLLGHRGAQAVGRAFRHMAIDKSRFTDRDLEMFRANAQIPGALTAMLNYYRALLRYPAFPDPAPILETPTLLIWGEEDTALGKELTYGTEALVSDFTLRYLPNVSHWVQQEAPEKVNAIMRAWISGETPPNYVD